MKYTSSNGCLFYYDRILYSWRICEPTMLFLLGFESATSFNTSQTDTITISKYMFLPRENSLEPLENFDIFDKAYEYLSEIGSVEDHETYLTFNCYGLKLFMNDMTGTGNDRTVPIIFRNEVNKTFLDFSLPNNTDLSFYDRQAEKILNIFDYASYDLTDNEFVRNSIGDTPIRPSIYDPDFEDLINKYNYEMGLYISARKAIIDSSAMSLHEERQKLSEVYTRLDYKAMYSYALGVLYGCRCLGYDPNLIWRIDPLYWYSGDYKNLVSTAWATFRFHYADIYRLPEDKDKFYNEYRGIQVNRLWNYSDENISVPLKSDEVPCYAAKRTNIEVVSYSRSTLPDITSQETIYPGSYYVYNDGNIHWKSIDDLVYDSPDMSGIISFGDEPIIRYISSNEVKIYRAYELDDTHYLSPNESNTYFIGAGSFGWLDFDEKSWMNSLVPFLSISPIPFEDLKVYSIVDGSYEQYIGYATSKEDGSLVAYYKSYVTSREDGDTSNKCFLYGIFDDGLSLKLDDTTGRYVVSSLPDNRSFVRLICGEDFDSLYNAVDVSIEGYTLDTYYDLSSKIGLYTKPSEVDDWRLIEIYTGTSSTAYLYTYGYSLNKSQLVTEVFTYSNDSEDPVDAELRYESVNNMYWSKYFKNSGIMWKTLSEVIPLELIYYKFDKTDLYSGITRIVYQATSYKLFGASDSSLYVFNYSRSNNNYTDSELHLLNYSSFISIPYLYSLGITTYACPLVLVDDDGNPLLDDNNNPAVWYDPINHKYWNGLHGVNSWQDDKPYAMNAQMYDALTNVLTRIYDNYNEEHPESSTVVIGNTTLSYSDFYSNPSYGIIRRPSDLDAANIFNPTKSPDILVCYYDSYSNKYCVPTYTTEWYTRSELSPELGWRFVDSYTSLYDGDDHITVIYDDDDTD